MKKTLLRHFKNKLKKNRSDLNFLFEHDNILNQYNYLSIQLLEQLGISTPSQKQIDIIEDLISTCNIQVRIQFADSLTEKEIACLYLAAKGKSSLETAKLLSMSQPSVEVHRKEIKRKLKCANMAQAVFEGMRYS